MAIYRILICAGFLISANSFAELNFDKSESINGVTVKSGKQNSTRIYQGSIEKLFPHQLETVKSSVVNFHEKCNNSYNDRRKYTDKSLNCKYHNENLIETLAIKEIKQSGWTKTPGEVERYVLGRRIYNRGNFGHYELVQVINSKNSKNQKTITIILTMLDDDEVQKYIKPSFERDSAFNETTSTFVLTEVAPNKTALHFEYHAKTEHWILNKEISIPQVFASISKSINDLVLTVETESTIQGRELASN